ncbi:hypothetical protein ACQWKP_24440, partial [Salmonella enterica subsp. enterica serovar Infantis]
DLFRSLFWGGGVAFILFEAMLGGVGDNANNRVIGVFVGLCLGFNQLLALKTHRANFLLFWGLLVDPHAGPDSRRCQP